MRNVIVINIIDWALFIGPKVYSNLPVGIMDRYGPLLDNANMANTKIKCFM